MERIQRDFQAVEGDVSGRVADLLRGSKTVKLHAMEAEVTRDFEVEADTIRVKSYRRDVLSHVEWIKQEGLSYVCYAALMAGCTWRYLDGHIDPYQSTWLFNSFVSDPLVVLDSDKVYKPALAAAWDVNADGTVWTFRLRPGVKFQDGTYMDAAAVKANFERMDYTDGIKHLQTAEAKGVKFEYPVEWGMDLQSEHERYLTETLVGRPVVLMNYPKGIKAFYMRLNDDERTVAAMDILAPGIGEIVGGSQREERLDVLDARMDEMHLDKSAYWWYRDLRRYGTVPHAGFGLGFERTIIYATGMANIRDVIPFPRTPRNAAF
jgi:hypothetical protein